jgi:hypothetical protein
MTDDDRSEEAREMEVVRTNTDALRVVSSSRADLYKGTYTNRWKDLCRDLLRDYARFSSEAIGGKPIGATTIRKHIFREIKDEKMTLTVDNIFDFLYKSVYPDDVTFSYIDQFLRSLQFEDATYDAVKRKMHIEIDDRMRSSLSRFYSFQKSENKISDRYLDAFLGFGLNQRRYRSP